MLNIKIGRLKICASFWFFAAIGFFVFFRTSTLFWYFAMPVIIHELGHVMAIYLCGSEVSELNFKIFGIDMVKADIPLSYTKEIIINIAGVIINLVTAGVIYFGAPHTMRSLLLSAVNLTVGIFNLLPLQSLDGGAVVKLICEKYGYSEQSYIITKVSSIILLLPMLAVSLYFAFGPQRNFSLLIITIYLTGVVIYQ